MEKRIDLERRGKDPSEITELNLDNSRATQIEGLTDDYVNLESLSLISVGLTSLKGFPKLPKLRKLELSENRISSGLNSLGECPNITHLNLSNNKIKELESLEPLKSFKCMTHLDLFNNEVCKIDDYRTKVFELVPNLTFLDGYDADENEAEESESEGYEGVNGTVDDEEEEDDDDDDDGEEEEDDDDDDGDIDDGPGLAAIYNLSPAAYNDKDDGDYKYNGEEEEDEEEDLDEEDFDEPKDKKRKCDDGEGDGGGGKDEKAE